ncbi:MAG: ATPase [Bergeyella sp.]|nr:ATPase [Bergeyella sp.]
MVAIADGGSTKCDWVFLDNKSEESIRTNTIGLNPNVTHEEEIIDELNKNLVFSQVKEKVSHVFFYGSGCGASSNVEKINNILEDFFPLAVVSIKEDLTAAAYSVYEGKPLLVCILGTGSNSCYFDGKEVKVDLPSLGFLVGDEGSGSALGKTLVKDYFMKKLPSDLECDFKETYALTIGELIKNLYHSPRANAYLADFSKFILNKKSHPYIQNLIYNELKKYFYYQVLPYRESRDCELGFIGSIAYYYEDILRSLAAEFHFSVGKIVQKPIDNLVDYHKRYILPHL